MRRRPRHTVPYWNARPNERRSTQLWSRQIERAAGLSQGALGNLPIVAALLLLFAANALFHAELAGLTVPDGLAAREVPN